jgi:hypothetical protein
MRHFCRSSMERPDIVYCVTLDCSSNEKQYILIMDLIKRFGWFDLRYDNFFDLHH